MEVPITQDLPSLFDGLNDVDVYTALRRFSAHDVQPGELIVEEGQAARGLVCVVDGELEIRTGNAVLGVARRGDLVGEMALFEKGARTASVYARTPARLLILPREGYEELRDVAHPIAHAIERDALALQVIRLAAVGTRIAQLSIGTPTELQRPTLGFFAAITALFGPGGPLGTRRTDPLDSIRRSPVFADAPPAAQEAIARHFVTESYEAGHVLCAEGEEGRRMFLLDDGQVEVIVAAKGDRLVRVATLDAGAVFGMVSLARVGPRMSTCVAATRVVVQALGLDGWHALIEDPWLTGSAFRRAIIRTFSQQLGVSNAQLAAHAATRARGAAEPADVSATPAPTDPLVRATAGMEVYGARFEGDPT